jgi:hypothetical protein
MRFVITVKMPSLNEYIDIERSSRYGAAGKKKQATNNVAMELRSQSREKLTGLYDLTIYWLVPDNRQDPDNIYFKTKFVLDGFVTASLLPGDGRKNIRHIDHRIRTVKGKEMVLLQFDNVLP